VSVPARARRARRRGGWGGAALLVLVLDKPLRKGYGKISRYDSGGATQGRLVAEENTFRREEESCPSSYSFNAWVRPHVASISLDETSSLVERSAGRVVQCLKTKPYVP
jgi:hypothetical protein